MSGTADHQEIVLNGTLPAEFKLVIVPFYRTTAMQPTQGTIIPVTQADVNTGSAILIPLSEGDSQLISVSVIYQIGRVINCIPGINIPADNRPIRLHFIQTGCVYLLTTGEPLNGLPECCDIHDA